MAKEKTKQVKELEARMELLTYHIGAITILYLSNSIDKHLDDAAQNKSEMLRIFSEICETSEQLRTLIQPQQ